jgi:linker histone H1 and H5 family
MAQLPKTYAEIIEEAILGLNEHMGSSRQAIWKVISQTYPAADYKLFVVRLKKMREASQLA